MKKLLLLGGSYSDIPLIQEAKRLGFYVITSGNKKEDLGHLYSDEFHCIDFSNKEDALALAKSLNIDAIVPSSHDLSMVSSAYIAEKLNINRLDSYETTLTLHHKDLFKKFALENDLLTPKAISFSSESQALQSDIINLRYPLIIKPIDLGGGKGITKISDKSQLIHAIKKAFEYSKAKKIVIEEFVEGTLHSFSTILVNQKVNFYFCDNEYSSKNNPYGVATSTSPMKAFEQIKNILIEQTQKVAKILDLKDGLLHMQFLFDGTNIHIVEFTRRMPGDWYYYPVEKSTKVNYRNLVLSGFLNMPLNVPQFKQEGCFSRHCIMATKKGKITNFHIDQSIKKDIFDTFTWYDKFNHVQDIVNEKFGLIFLQYDSLEEMEEKTHNIHNLIYLDIQ